MTRRLSHPLARITTDRGYCLLHAEVKPDPLATSNLHLEIIGVCEDGTEERPAFSAYPTEVEALASAWRAYAAGGNWNYREFTTFGELDQAVLLYAIHELADDPNHTERAMAAAPLLHDGFFSERELARDAVDATRL